MARHLLTVEDAFFRIELRKPDGSSETPEADANVPFLDPPRFDRPLTRHMFLLDLPKDRVPVCRGQDN
jgi:hypothetical protein